MRFTADCDLLYSIPNKFGKTTQPLNSRIAVIGCSSQPRRPQPMRLTANARITTRFGQDFFQTYLEIEYSGYWALVLCALPLDYNDGI